MLQVLEVTSKVKDIYKLVESRARQLVPESELNIMITRYFQVLEVFAHEGWVMCSVNKKDGGTLTMSNDNQRFIRFSDDTQRALEEAGRADIVRSNLDTPAANAE